MERRTMSLIATYLGAFKANQSNNILTFSRRLLQSYQCGVSRMLKRQETVAAGSAVAALLDRTGHKRFLENV